MIKNFFVAIIIYLFISSSQAEIVKKIVINGNNRVSDETIAVYGDIKTNKDYSEIDLNNILKNLYSTEFFENVDLSLKNQILNINVKEYPIVNQLILIGEKRKGYKEEIKKLIKLKEKKSFIKADLSNDIEIIKKLYSSLGFNFAKIEPKIKF